MPNWCCNRLSIKKEYLDKVFRDGEVDFEILAPVPEEVMIINDSFTRIAQGIYEYIEFGIIPHYAMASYYSNINAEEVFKKGIKEQETSYQNIDHTDPFVKEKIERLNKYPTLYHLGKQLSENEKKYGCPTAYEWCRLYWGSKWNASDTHIEIINHKGTELAILSFDTPNEPPEGWLYTLATVCPFYLEWVEEGGEHGEYVYDGQEFLPEHFVTFDIEKDNTFYFDEKKLEVINWSKGGE